MTAGMVRRIAAGAAGASALLYYLIGIGLLDIGESTSGETDLLSFGLTAGTAFLAAALLAILVHRRWVVALIGLLDAAVIVGYFAMAGIRVPPFEVWGLAIKLFQVVFLVSLGYLLLHRESAGARSSDAYASM